MGPPSRTTASTPALIRPLDFQIILGKVRPLSHRPTEAHPEVLIIAPLVAAVITVDRRGSHSGFVMPHAAAARGGVWLLVSRRADSIDQIRPPGFESSAVTGDHWLGELVGGELEQQGSV